MGGYLLRRLLAAIPTLIGVTLVVFTLLSILPSDPILSAFDAGTPLSIASVERLRAQAGPARPPAVRYADWIVGIARLDFGQSMRDARPVVDLILEGLPFTLLLNLCAITAIYGVGIPLGWMGARRRGTAADRLADVLLVLAAAVPPVAAGMLLQRLFAVRLGLLPLQGIGADPGDFWPPVLELGRHLILPSLCLALSGWAFAAHFCRAAFRTLHAGGFISAARARGLSGLGLVRHAAPNAAAPLLSLVGAVIPGLIAGSVVVEEVFSWPGLGRILLRAIEGRDFPVVMALMLISALMVLLGQLLTDLLYPWLDPRLREVIAAESEIRG